MRKLFLLLITLASFSANATLLSLSLDQSQYQQGETVNVQLVASDLSFTLGGFAAELSFDPATLSLTDVVFGNGFDDGFGSFSFADDATPGAVFVEDYADLFADEAIIAANQGVSFVLASFSFTAVALGAHSIDLLNGAELISFDNQLLEVLDGLSVAFDVTAVPEPGILALILTGLLVLRRRS